jgi:hypothetical protein
VDNTASRLWIKINFSSRYLSDYHAAELPVFGGLWDISGQASRKFAVVGSAAL